MSLESTRFIPTTPSPNLPQPFHNKHFHDHMNHTTISKKQNYFKTEAVNFLKTSLNTLIKDQLKGYRLQKKLEKELQQFNKKKQGKQLMEDLHKIQKFRQKQSDHLKAKYDEYQKSQQKKQHLIDQVSSIKRQLARKKKQENDRKIQQVRKRFLQTQNQDIQNRLSRADSTLSQKNSIHKDKLSTSRHRNIYTSVNQRKTINPNKQDEEEKKITNYLKKMKHAQSRIIEKEMSNQQRKQKSIKNQVKNLTRERNQKEQSLMKQWEEKLENKMGSFYENLSRSQLQNGNLLLHKSRMKQQLRERVIKNKQMHDNILVNKTLNNFMRKKADKQNLYRNHQRKIDILRTKSSFMNNTIQIQKQELEKQSERNIRILYQKINKIKDLKPNQTLTEKEREALLSLIDTEDPVYPELAEFLTQTKNEFLRKKLQKQEEKAKAQKTKKSARFHNKN